MGTCKLYTVPVAVYRVGMCATPHTPQGGFPSLSLYLGSRPAPGCVVRPSNKVQRYSRPCTKHRIRKLACGRCGAYGFYIIQDTLLSSKLCFER